MSFGRIVKAIDDMQKMKIEKRKDMERVAVSTAFEDQVWATLKTVPDPEIPPLSIVDLGIVERVEASDEEIRVDLLPTFAGCPALDVIQRDVSTALERGPAAGRPVTVRFVTSPPWTSDRITPAGREALRDHGL